MIITTPTWLILSNLFEYKISNHELQPRIMSGWFSLTNQNPAGPFLVCFSFLNKIVFCLATGFLKWQIRFINRPFCFLKTFYKQTILFLVVWKLLELTIKNFLGKLWFGGKSRKLFRWFCSHTELNFSRFLESRQYVFDFGPHLTSYPTTDCGWPLPPPYGPKP